jgi:hypothetical protein
MILAGLTTTNAASNSSDTFLGPFLTSASTATESSVLQAVPIAGTISNLAVDIGSAPGGGRSWTFTIRKNGTTDTAVTCPISGGGGTSCTSSSSVTFAAGDQLSLRVHPSSSAPGNWTSARWSVTLTAG